jgi:hypothetical protein
MDADAGDRRVTTNSRVDTQPPTAPAALLHDLWRVIDVIRGVDTSITLHKLNRRGRAATATATATAIATVTATAAGVARAALERRRCR